MSSEININDFKFDDKGLLVAIAVDAESNEVLMQAFMNMDALRATIESGYATYYSRSRQKLWKKGETSGNTQRVVEIKYDCDMDSVLLRVIQNGAACHTGNRSCFYRSLGENEHVADGKIFYDIAETIKKRKSEPKEGSYTNYLFDKGIEKICKKVGEESTEAVIAAIKGDKEELIGEISDIAYHLLVLMEASGIEIKDVAAELMKREGKKPKPKYAILDDDKERNRDK